MLRENLLKADMPFVFLLCSERSGSNLITKILDAHPEICGPAPSHLIRTFSRNLWRYGDITQDENWHVLCEDVADFLNNQLGKWETQCAAGELKKEVRQRSLSAIIRHIYEDEARTRGKSKVFVKENQTYSFISFLLAGFPDSKFIYMVRDPRDMALSLKLSPATPGRVHRAGQLWKTDQERSIELYGMLKDSGKVILLRYEDLLVNTENELRRICGFLEVGYSSLMLEFYTSDLTVENSQRIDAWQNLQKPVLKMNFCKYRTGLSELEIRYIESLCIDEMQLLGYHCDFPQTAKSPELEKQLLEFEKQTTFDQAETLSDEEEIIRADRMSVIERIIQRNLCARSKAF